MPNITERTDELVEELIYCDLRNSIGLDKAKSIVRRALRRQDILESRFRHIHVNKHDGTDTCKECGFDLRDPIHVGE